MMINRGNAQEQTIRAVVIGCSTGGLEALRAILSELPSDFCAPVLIVQHLSPQSGGYTIAYLNEKSHLLVKEADEKEKAIPGTVYLAPPNYHLLVEKDGTLSLSVDEKVNFARPSVDVLFESAADAYKTSLVGVILTGANKDGAIGIKKIKQLGGITIVQNPETALVDSMPKAALMNAEIDYVLDLENIAVKLIELTGDKNEHVL